MHEQPSALKQPLQTLPRGTTMGALPGQDHPTAPEPSGRARLPPCSCVAVPKGMNSADLHLRHPPRRERTPPVPLDCLVAGLICQEIISHCPLTLRAKHSQPVPLHLQPETGRLIGIFLWFYMRSFSIIL